MEGPRRKVRYKNGYNLHRIGWDSLGPSEAPGPPSSQSQVNNVNIRAAPGGAASSLIDAGQLMGKCPGKTKLCCENANL